MPNIAKQKPNSKRLYFETYKHMVANVLLINI